jgi:hypothetical protein
MSKVLAGMQGLGAGEKGVSELARIRADLDRRLAVARKVEERMRTLESQMDTGTPDADRAGPGNERG